MREKVSVALATFNGEKYIEEQIRSVLDNLSDEDEIIVSDDGSSDETLKVIESVGDERIHCVLGPKQGVKKNFENAIRHCSGKYIFLCDQDDVWMHGKVDKVLEGFADPEVKVVTHDCSLVNDAGEILLESYFDYRKSGPGIFKNFMKNSYMGCCMAFDSSIKENILPIPADIEMHDQWIGLIAENKGKSLFIKDRLIEYRRHEKNVSDCFNHYGFSKMLINRLRLLKNLLYK